MKETEYIPAESAINQAKRMNLRSKEQSKIVDALIYHIDMLSITVRNQRKQLERLNKKHIPPNLTDNQAGEKP